MTAKPVLLVLGCEKYRASLVTALQRFASPVWEIVGCIGHPAAKDPEYNEAERIVYLPVPDTYEALPTKVHAAFMWIQEKWPDAPGIFKTDEDIFIEDMPALESAIQANITVPFWGLKVSNTTQNYISVRHILQRFTDTSLRPMHQTARYCYGAGYWVSKAALAHIRASHAIYQASCMEDVCTGYVLNSNGIFPERVAIEYKEMPRQQ